MFLLNTIVAQLTLLREEMGPYLRPSFGGACNLSFSQLRLFLFYSCCCFLRVFVLRCHWFFFFFNLLSALFTDTIFLGM